MREILFRGKRVDNGEWVYGNLITDDDDVYILPQKNLSKGIDIGGWIDGVQSYEVNPETVGQYTGLKDLHGTRIFEADIVKVYDIYCNETVVGVVEFCDGSFHIYDKDFTSYDRWMYCKVEVIGNIHDNPELLER
jgi:uncharacterized phage protein (TIGR01671 family)